MFLRLGYHPMALFAGRSLRVWFLRCFALKTVTAHIFQNELIYVDICGMMNTSLCILTHPPYPVQEHYQDLYHCMLECLVMSEISGPAQNLAGS